MLLLGGRARRQAQAGRARASQAGLRSQMPRARLPGGSAAAGQIRGSQLYDPLRDAARWRDGRRRPGEGPDGLSERRARRFHHRALRRLADLQLRQHPRRRRHAHHAHRSRRRPRVEYSAPDADGVRARVHAASLRAFAAGAGTGRLAAVEASRRDFGDRVSRERLFPRGDAELPGAAWMVARRPGNFLEGRADRLFWLRGVRKISRRVQSREIAVAQFPLPEGAAAPAAGGRDQAVHRPARMADSGRRRVAAKRRSRRCTSAPRRWSSWWTSRRSI